MSGMALRVVRSDGFLALYNGLSASLGRQVCPGAPGLEWGRWVEQVQAPDSLTGLALGGTADLWGAAPVSPVFSASGAASAPHCSPEPGPSPR